MDTSDEQTRILELLCNKYEMPEWKQRVEFCIHEASRGVPRSDLEQALMREFQGMTEIMARAIIWLYYRIMRCHGDCTTNNESLFELPMDKDMSDRVADAIVRIHDAVFEVAPTEPDDQDDHDEDNQDDEHEWDENDRKHDKLALACRLSQERLHGRRRVL